MVPPPFNPRNCQLGLYRWVPYDQQPTIQLGSTGPLVGYAKGVLYCKANQPCRPEANPGPWVFNQNFKNCVISFQTFFGIPATGVISAQTWEAIQYCANFL